MKIIGHRGAAGLVAENTVESIAEAFKYNVDGIEIDIHKCKSGELVVIHDETLERTTNGKGKVSEFTLQELKKYRTKEGYRIPTLNEVLDFINAKCILNIELKGIGTAGPVMELLERRIKDSDWDYDDFILSSFDHSQLFQIKSKTFKFKLGVLTEKNIPSILKVAEVLEAFSVHPPILSLQKEEVTSAKNNGFKVYTWTVNDSSKIKSSKTWKVDGIITDFPNFA
ncbi:glycerophosphodiester phosphodiesterase [Aquimarina sp. AD1]|uniref:glycerophosphodiester phosphodiesterase n=1 Tax=Aquimarina sp. (strain AD1) TaxID=1714848 RepID=UPI000E507B34|nr:glycerophosphodiester phosphodiesterase family protein [Aquimarina sp. AD1]AXT56900.1 glycerophosphodiester phosphodiesterase [Aquimarina sp. AD1]RKN18419.1 glycerophosphodiester phosphodiesterase [Aquimarina sp. AD1]